MSLDEVGRADAPQRGEEERQRVDAVLVHVPGAVEVVDGRRDVRAPAGPRVEGVGQGGVRPVAVALAHERGRRERQVARPEHVEVARARREGAAVPAAFDARLDDRAGIAGVAGVPTELTTQADAGVVHVFGEDRRGDPGGDGHET